MLCWNSSLLYHHRVISTTLSQALTVLHCLCPVCITRCFTHFAHFYGCLRQEAALAGIKIARRNISNLRYADDTTLMAESEEEIKSLLMKVKEESEKVSLKLNIQTMKIMASCSITSWQIDGETVEAVADFILGGLQNHCRW